MADVATDANAKASRAEAEADVTDEVEEVVEVVGLVVCVTEVPTVFENPLLVIDLNEVLWLRYLFKKEILCIKTQVYFNTRKDDGYTWYILLDIATRYLSFLK